MLADHRVAPALVLLRAHKLEPGLLIDVARGGKHAVRPQRHLPVARIAREANAFVCEVPAKPEAARFWVDQQQADARDGLRLLRQDDRTDILAVHLGYPAAFALVVEFIGEAATICAHTPSKGATQPYSCA